MVDHCANPKVAGTRKLACDLVGKALAAEKEIGTPSGTATIQKLAGQVSRANLRTTRGRVAVANAIEQVSQVPRKACNVCNLFDLGAADLRKKWNLHAR